MAPWKDITPLRADGKPSPQRVLVNTDDGVPTLRVLPDTTYSDAKWRLPFGVAILAAGTASIYMMSVGAILSFAVALIVGMAIVVPSLWVMWGQTIFRVYPAHLEVSWRIGWLQFRRRLSRSTALAIVIHERSARLLPLPMSGAGLLAALSVDISTETRPILFTRALVTREVAAWLADSMAMPIEVTEPPSPEPYIQSDAIREELDRLGDGWTRMAISSDGFGMPQPLWMRRQSGHLQLAILSNVEIPTKWEMNRRQILFFGGSAAVAISFPLFLDSDLFSLLLIFWIGAVVVLIIAPFFILKDLIWKSPRSSPPFMHLSRIDISDSSISLLTASDEEPETLERELIESIQLFDYQYLAESSLLIVGFRARPEESILFDLSSGSDDSIMILLHPATAETLAQLIHEETGIPIERDYV